MKKVMLILLSALTMFACLSFSAVSPQAVSGLEDSSQRPTEGLYRYQNTTVSVYPSYDKNGRVLKDGIFKHFYDRSGNELDFANSASFYPTFGFADSLAIINNEEIKVTYNTDNTPKTIRTYNSEGSQVCRYEMTYDNKGLITTMELYLSKGREFIKTYEHDASGKITSISCKADYMPDVNYWWNETYQYRSGKLAKIEHEMYNPLSGNMTHVTVTYTYDSANRLTRVETQDKGAAQPVVEIGYEYDKSGKLTRMTYFDHYIGWAQESVEYEYSQQPQTVTFVDSYPKTGFRHTSFYTPVKLTFSHDIKSVNFTSGQISLVSLTTGETVYQQDFSQQIQRGTISFYNKDLTWRISMTAAQHFPKGEDLYVKMTGNFLTFRDTSATVELGNPQKNPVPEVIYHIISDKEQQIPVTARFVRSMKGDLTDENKRVGSIDYVYSDSYFTSTSLQYNHDLAIISLMAAMSSMNAEEYKQKKESDVINGSLYITQLLKDMGFGGIWHNKEYDTWPGTNTTGVCIGTKKMYAGNTTLIAVAVRSGGYKGEWGGNFVVGPDSRKDHLGFSYGRDNVIEALKQYIADNNITGNVKFWIFGYSRGSAIANLTAAWLDDGNSLGANLSYAQKDIYAYCFEVPASTTSSQAGSSRYANIFNIINPIDVVPRLPLMKWGFTRYGKVMFLPYKGTDFWLYFDQVKDLFRKMYGESYAGIPYGEFVNKLNKVFEMLGNKVPTRNEFNRYDQASIVSALNEYFKNGPKTDKVELVMALLLLIYEAKPDQPLDLLRVVSEGAAGLLIRLRKIYKVLNDADLKNILFGHYTEYNLAWMMSIPNGWYLKESMESSGTSSSSTYARLMVKVNCPVDVAVYDSEHNLLAAITGDDISNPEGSPVIAYVDETGAKCFEIDEMNDVVLDIRPYASGTMSIDINALDLATNQPVKATHYNDIILEKDQSFTMDLDSGYSGSDYEAVLMDHQENVIEAKFEETGEAIPLHDVNVTVIGEGQALGIGSVVEGSYVQLNAVAQEGHEFAGWYDDSENLLSSETEYRFQVNANLYLTAKFTEIPVTPPEPEKPKENQLLKTVLIVGGIIAVITVGELLLMKRHARKNQLRAEKKKQKK
ncbi:MAG: hypothetical protein II161_03795 [Erysipelotrichaceae bacterium]|nr:hypothetical protein [Erysipelotrichaceae bacterium]